MAVRVAVVGMGVGRVHVKALSTLKDEVEVAAVCDLNEEVAREAAAGCGAEVFGDYATMLDRARLDAVVLATPPAVHAEQAAMAAERGSHVLCEKPMAPSVADCERMIDACDKASVTLMIAFKKRFYPCYRAIKRKVDETGAPIQWANVRFALGRVEKDWFWDEANGGGPLLENAIHEYDILRFLMGEVQQAYAAGGNLFMPHRAPQLDTAAVCLSFAGGGVASMGIGYGSEWGFAREELALASSKLAIELQGPFDGPDSLRYVMRDDPASVLAEDLPAMAGVDAFVPQLCHFLACVRGEAECESTGRDGLAAVRIALAVKRSIRQGRIVSIAEGSNE